MDANGYFETFVMVVNGGDDPAHVVLWHQLITPNTGYDGDWPGAEFDLPPHSRSTVNVADTIHTNQPSPVHEWSVSTRVEADRPVFAERSVYWTSDVSVSTGHMNRQAATESVGVTSAADNWYLAEGCSNLAEYPAGPVGFETWVLVQNPGDATAEVDIKYQTTDEEIAGPHLQLAPNTRRSINIADTVKVDSVSTTVSSDEPVVVERAMYYSGLDGGDNPVPRISAHDSTGVTASAADWYLPMGQTRADAGGILNTYILVQNPSDSPANVTIDFLGDGSDEETAGEMVEGTSFTLQPKTRYTLPIELDNPGLFNKLVKYQWFSTIVTADRPVIAEKAVYHSYPTQPGDMGTQNVSAMGSLGLAEESVAWFMAEGSTADTVDGAFTTYIGIANIGPVETTARVTYLTPDGIVAGPVATIDPYTLKVIDAGATVANEWSVSTNVSSDRVVVCERAMYWTVPIATPATTGPNPGRESASSCGGMPENL